MILHGPLRLYNLALGDADGARILTIFQLQDDIIIRQIIIVSHCFYKIYIVTRQHIIQSNYKYSHVVWGHLSIVWTISLTLPQLIMFVLQNNWVFKGIVYQTMNTQIGNDSQIGLLYIETWINIIALYLNCIYIFLHGVNNFYWLLLTWNLATQLA